MKEFFKLKKWLLIFLLFPGYSFVCGQTVITGKVISESSGEALTGANVIEKGTTNGSVTDLDGNYTITLTNPEAVLEFSYMGYTPSEVEVGTRTIIDVALADDIEMFDEVVVISYGGLKKKEVTGAVSTVKSEDILKNATSDLGQSLQGQIAGVSVTSSSGAPGAQANVSIRGIGSFSAGSVNPLYVVDGIPQEGVPNIPPEEIESLSVLKDGASAAAYGTRASNGVILIKTKRGEKGELKVSYSSYFGIQNITSGIDLMNTEEQLFAEEQEAQINNGGGAGTFILNPDAMKYDNDFVGYITQDNAPMMNHTLTLSGGTENASLRSITNYYSQDGVLKNSGYERLSTRINGTLKRNKFTAFTSIGVQMDRTEASPWGIYEAAIIQRPYTTLPSGGTETVINDNPEFFGTFGMDLQDSDVRNTNSINVTVDLQYEIIKGLTYQIRGGGNLYNYKRAYWRPTYTIYDAQGNVNIAASRFDAILRQDYQYNQKWTLENLLTYTKSFGKHKINLLAGYTNEGTYMAEEQVEKSEFIDNTTQVFSAGNISTMTNGRKEENGLVGFLGRIQYSYNEKYMASATVRRDGSSNFGSGRKKETFYGGSVGWNIHEEVFLKNISFINNLKLRAGIAEVGNQAIEPYQYSAAIVPGTYYHFNPEGEETLLAGATQRGYANPKVQWETNNTKNIGLDASLFSGKLSTTIDLYHNSKTEMLIPVDLPPSAGTWIPRSTTYNSRTTNVGDMINKGIELSLSYNRNVSDFKWTLGGTFSKNVNEVTSLPESLGDYALGGGQPIIYTRQTENTAFVQQGQPVPTFFLVPTDGVIKTEEELAEYEVQFSSPTGARVGDLRWVDSNGDSISDGNDRVSMGSPWPEFELGLNFNAEYKGFDLYIQLFYSHGGKIYNGSKALAYQNGRHKEQFYQWLPSNSTSDVPTMRFSPQHRNFSAMTDQYLEDATYLRVRNITLGYTLPQQISEKIKIQRTRVYVRLQNPLTFTKYTGFDPEVGYSEGNFNGGGNAIFSKGVDRGNYPASRQFHFGLQVDF